jgi:predicted 3-demethylubiquinone-9 3-methyltransferase (glyoxalase superfamily)
MFEGSAEAAVNLYVSLFRDSAIERIERYGPGEAGAVGSVKRVDFKLAGQPAIAIDSPLKHNFTFTPSLSLFVECESEAELDKVFDQLSPGGSVLMPPGNYGFSTKFTWISDRFGVSWQLNLK